MGPEPLPKALLPIDAYEQQIIDTVALNRVTIVIGATGSGKTTQIAQFLHRAGYCDKGMVGVSQPRRVAAVTVARWDPQNTSYYLWKKKLKSIFLLFIILSLCHHIIASLHHYILKSLYQYIIISLYHYIIIHF